MRKLYINLSTILTLFVLWTNYAVHTAPRIGSQGDGVELRAQLSYLEARVHGGLGEEMQRLFPEGSVFTHALYGLAWCGYAQRSAVGDNIREHGLVEARWAFEQLERSDVQGQFPVLAQPKFGVFYCGWRNYLLGSILALDTIRVAERDSFRVYSADLEHAFSQSASPFLKSYNDMAWPADNVVAMASLSLHEQLCGASHGELKARWMDRVRARRDERGMIPHAWDPTADRQREHARGCSQALMNVLLPLIDGTLAQEQFELFRQHFFMERFGVPLVREYPLGVNGWGDVDSGPVIMGAGCAASIVGTAACRANGDPFHAQEFDCTIEGFGLVTGGERKRYLLGVLPIADLFIAWGRSLPSVAHVEARPAFKRFHLWSILGAVLLWSPLWVGVLRRRIREKWT